MTFIIVLISVLLERFFSGVELLRPWGWLPRYYQWLDNSFGKYRAWESYLRLIGILVPVLVLVGLIQVILIKFTPSWFLFLIDLLALIYCVGPRNFYASLGAPQASEATETEMLLHEEEHHATRGFVTVNALLVSVLFWFVIFGPVGAFLYRLSAENQQGDNAAKQLTRLLEWVPARLFSFTYALVGHFVAVLPVWLSRLWAPLDQNDTVLQTCGDIALGDMSSASVEETESAVRSLVDRSLIVWLVVLALVILL